MNKKIKITESQYNNLMKLLVETPFNQLTNSIIKVGDTMRVFTDATEAIGFNVTQISSSITMTGLNGDVKGQFIFINQDSLNGSTLSFRHTEESKSAENPNTWASNKFENVSKIEISRDGETVDEFVVGDQQTNDNEPENEKNKFKNSIEDELGVVVDNLKIGKGLVIKFKSDVLNMCCTGFDSNGVSLEVPENIPPKLQQLKKYTNISIKLKNTEELMKDNSDILKTEDGGMSFDLLVIGGDGDLVKEQIWIKNILGFSVTNDCKDFSEKNQDKKETEEERKAREKIEDEERAKKSKEDRDYENMKAEELRVFGKKAYDAIVNDPSLRAAFYSQPTFWEAFKSGLTGKKHPGHGIITTLNIVDKYMSKKVDGRLGGDFNLGESVSFKFENPFSLSYTDTNGDNQTADIKGEFEYEGRVRRANSYDVRMIFVKDKGINLGVTIKDPVKDDPYVFICDATIYNDKGEVAVGSKKENIKTFISPSSTGYKPHNKNN